MLKVSNIKNIDLPQHVKFKATLFSCEILKNLK